MIEAAVVLDVRAVWVRELARALSTIVPTTALLPGIHRLGMFQRDVVTRDEADGLRVGRVNLQAGWWRSPLLSETGKLRRFIDLAAGLRPSTLVVLTSPHYVRAHRALDGCTCCYYVTDNFRACFPKEARRIAGLEAGLAARVDHVFPNSERTARFFRDTVGIDEDRVTVIPNGVRGENIPPAPLLTPEVPPAALATVTRPWALVMGNLAGNTDWPLLENVVTRTPWLSWVFVGPVGDGCADRGHEQARARLLASKGRVVFTGHQPYGQLVNFSRSCDVAVLPYLKREPTFSGSATRFYEHLAAGRPILSTAGVDELLSWQPLVEVCRAVPDWVAALERLRQSSFSDGLETERWKRAHEETWACRAARMLGTINAGRPQVLGRAHVAAGGTD